MENGPSGAGPLHPRQPDGITRTNSPASFEGRADEGLEAFPAAPVPGVFAGLSHPTSQPVAATAKQGSSDATKVGPFHWLVRGVRALVTSSELCSGAGSTVLSLASLNVSGLILHPVASLLGAVNAFRHRYFPSPPDKQIESPPREGVRAFLWEKLHSPGVYRIVTASIFTGNTIEAIWRQDHISTAIFGLCVLANSAGARLLNRNYAVEERKPIVAEAFFHKLWARSPDAAKTILANPTIPFSLASILIGTRGISSAALTAPLSLTSFLLAGTVFIHGTIKAMRAGEFFEPRPMSFILSGLSQIAMGFANISSGNELN
ncbi:MAG: hypothetical protein K1X79_13510, partial [Oligoflexia bacterium]|nr:hypothetical protein [Oligoflexia bacterium]